MTQSNFIIYSLIYFLFCTFNVSSQNLEWASSINGPDESVLYENAVDGNGNVYTVGTFMGTADFDPGTGTFNLTSSGGQDVYIQKLDPNGNFLWAKSVGGSSNDYSYSLELSGDTAVVIGGSFNGTADFDPGVDTFNLTSANPSTNFEDAFILKLNEDGAFIWAKSFGGDEDESLFEVKIDALGNIFTTGNYHSPMDADPGVGVTNVDLLGSHAVYLQKLNPQGDLIWVRTMDGSLDNLGKDMAITQLGEIYLIGSFGGNLDADPGPAVFSIDSEGNTDVFLIKLDSNGDFIWAKSFGGTGNESPNDIVLNSQNEVILIGRFENSVDFDPGVGQEMRGSQGDYDVFVWKGDENGELIWVNAFGGGSDNQGFTLATNSADDIFAAGFFRASMDVDPGYGVTSVTSAGNMDCFLVEFTNNGDFVGVQTYGGSSWDYVYSMSIDDNEKLYLNGLFLGTTDLDPDANSEFLVTSGGDYDGYVIKVSSITLATQTLENNDVSIYPNPTKDNLHIDLGNTEASAQIEITDALGNTIFSEHYTNSPLIDISLDAHPVGIYFVKVGLDDSSQTVKIVKQ